MTKEEKIKAILEAVASKKASANVIEPTRKGATISALKKGAPVQDKTVDKLYDALLGLSSPLASQQKSRGIEQAKGIEQAPSDVIDKKSTTSITTMESRDDREVQKLMEQIASLTQENKGLMGEIVSLRDQVSEMSERLDKIESITKSETIQTQSITESIKPSITTGIEKHESMNCMGFSVSKDREGRFYGVKRIAGKLKSVYIGRDLGKAQEKIQAFLDRQRQ